MRLVIQRVSSVSVTVNNQIIAKIKSGLLVLLGIESDDTNADADWLIRKMMNMRIFSDNEGKMNLSCLDIKVSFLVVSQFTLHASTKKGNRPSFIKAARPETAIPLYNYFITALQSLSNLPVESGSFGEEMRIELVNEGPVTIIIDTKMKE
jgi:D-tyrosyl-tRNA(Tyr) deacylase